MPIMLTEQTKKHKFPILVLTSKFRAPVEQFWQGPPLVQEIWILQTKRTIVNKKKYCIS
jgi:hypothetical protein